MFRSRNLANQFAGCSTLLKTTAIVIPLLLAGAGSQPFQAQTAYARTTYRTSPYSQSSLAARLVGTWRSTDRNGPTGEEANKVVITRAGENRLKMRFSGLEGTDDPSYFRIDTHGRLHGMEATNVIYILRLTPTRLTWREGLVKDYGGTVRTWRRVGAGR
ncbi:MAG: hypothetical protein M3Y56_06310 [Armatimonadota bacterium]|nr:hypothetical protein [Armatimonadota bacterium]